MVNKEKNRGFETSSLDCSKTCERTITDNDGTGVLVGFNKNLFLSRLGQVLCKNLCFLYQVFAPASLVSFRSVQTLRSHLVRAKAYPVGERLIGSMKCNKLCF